jgi:MFS family permease
VQKPMFYGWILLGALWFVFAFNLGFPAYGGPWLNTAMGAEYGFSRETLGLITSFYIIMSGLPGPVVAMSVNRFGSRRTLIAGGLMNVAGATYMATLASSGVEVYIAFGLVIGGGVCTGAAIASQTALSRWFVRRRAMAMSILYSSGAIAGLVANQVILPWVTHDRQLWRSGWWLIAALSGIAVLLALFVVREKPEDMGLLPDGEAPLSASGPARARPNFITTTPWEFRDAVRQPSYWLIVFSLIGGSGGYTLFLAHGIVHLTDIGHSPTVAFGVIGWLAGAGLLAKAVLVAFGDRTDPRWIWVGFMVFFGAGLILFINPATPLMVSLAATCVGIGFGGGVVCLMTVLGNYFGLKAFALLSGIAIAINTTLSALAPYIAGYLFDHGYGYDGACYFLAGWCFLGALVLFLLRRPVLAPTAVPA